MATFKQQWQSWVIVTKTIWPTKYKKIPMSWCFRRKVCQPLLSGHLSSTRLILTSQTNLIKMTGQREGNHDVWVGKLLLLFCYEYCTLENLSWVWFLKRDSQQGSWLVDTTCTCLWPASLADQSRPAAEPLWALSDQWRGTLHPERRGDHLSSAFLKLGGISI